MKLTTVLMIVAPHEIQTIAAPIMRRYALDTLIRVPAHLTVLYPFVACERLPEACQILREVCAAIPPFDVTMSGYDQFPTAIYMKPVDPAPIQDVFRRVYARFPECPPYGGQWGDELQPHMTVAEFQSDYDMGAALKSLPVYRPTRFHVDRLHVMAGIDHEPIPWLTHDIIPLAKA